MIYSIGTYTINTEKQELLYADTPQKVEPLTFKILTYMLENPNRVITRDELLQNVWSSRYISDATLTTSISVARHAVGDNAKKQKCIQTVSGSGYRFIAAFDQHDKNILELSKAYNADKSNIQHLKKTSNFPLLPDKPSIAIMDFIDVSKNQEASLLAYGLTSEINASFAKMPHFLVIARASASQLSNINLSSKEVGERLGVRYLVYGKLEQVASRIRATLSVVEAIQNTEIFSDHFDYSFDDIFQLQDDITKAIVMATDSAITQAEIERAFNNPTEDLNAWGNYHRGIWYLDRPTQSDNAKSEVYFEQAIKQDCRFARAHAWLSYTYTNRRLLDHSKIRKTDYDMVKSINHAEHCIDFNPNEMLGYMCLGRATLHFHSVKNAEPLIDYALKLSPNNPYNLRVKAQITARLGDDYKLANQYLDLYDRITPYSHFDKLLIIMIRIVILINQKRYSAAAAQIDQAVAFNNKYFLVFALATATHQLAGNQNEAQQYAIETLRLLPSCTTDSCQRLFSCKEAPRERFIQALHAAGIPKANQAL